jgi:hypothetical protein
MATWASGSVRGGFAALALAALGTGCFSSTSGSSSGSAGGSGGVSYGGSSSGAGAPAQPLLVVVDTGQTLTAQGGQGVGVFTEYQQGGHWHVWWTCDTALTQLDCQFQVTVSGGSGGASGASPLTAVAAQFASAGAQYSQPSVAEIVATSTTSLGVDGLDFDATPGGTITLEAQVNGTGNGSFLFFVQDGQVNGGYKGAISDPLMLQPSAP